MVSAKRDDAEPRPTFFPIRACLSKASRPTPCTTLKCSPSDRPTNWRTSSRSSAKNDDAWAGGGAAGSSGRHGRVVESGDAILPRGAWSPESKPGGVRRVPAAKPLGGPFVAPRGRLRNDVRNDPDRPRTTSARRRGSQRYCGRCEQRRSRCECPRLQRAASIADEGSPTNLRLPGFIEGGCPRDARQRIGAGRRTAIARSAGIRREWTVRLQPALRCQCTPLSSIR